MKKKQALYCAPFNQLYAYYKRNAKTRGLKFQISKGHFRRLVLKSCYYCGSGPKKIISKSGVIFRYNGLDRVSSVSGYTNSNVLPCCADCNFLKSTKSTEVFLSQVENIAKFLLKMKP